MIAKTTETISYLGSVIGVTLITLLPFGSTRSQAAKEQLDLSSYVLTFAEEFDTLDVSAWGPGTRWIAHTPWNGDFGDAAFADPVPGFPFVVEDGVLRIEARRGADGKWKSGLIASTDSSGKGFSQKFGYFEMRAQFPAGPGLWPAFWLIANRQPDASAEIDIVEQYSAFQDKYESVVHVWKKTEKGRTAQTLLRHTVPAGLLHQGFHTYGASVEPDWIVFYFDGHEMGRTETPPEHHYPMFLLANLALGGGWPIDQTPNPSFMYIDYIRAYQKAERRN